MYDTVYAYWCRSLPLECQEADSGTVKRPLNKFEWNISPSRIERTLIFSMKTLQLKCYVVLKILESHVINSCLNNNGKLTSFHCKTALFSPRKCCRPKRGRKTACLNVLIIF
ncbi:hypothetical protein MAR_001893 [Mya arenaria]|uniref:Uncharacterized protein n=1 Tax=Mya arenaria TaxID=6604 RepID=A0ABY7FD92_MYAAR|nr:hypothetical protein MAR_001893 [Mya arenaria]